MKCDKCGTELLKGNTIEAATDVVHSDSRCIDAIRAQLASMTKRAQESRDEMNRLIEGLHDLSVAKHAAEAKLAWAVEGLEEIARLYEPQTVAHIKAKHTLRTLGVDPSKEQEK